MTDPKLTYVGPLPQLTSPGSKGMLRSIPWPFLIVVVAPTLVAAIYLLFIATPRYVSEARFIVRAAGQPQVSSLGAALQGVGLSTGTADSHAVHEYIASSDGMRDLSRRVNVRAMYSRPGVDVFSRLPGPLSDDSEETFRKQFKRYLTVGYDSQSGISTLRIEAFTAKDAQAIANALLDGGEHLVNGLNERSAADAVSEAEKTLLEAQVRVRAAQTQLTAFRNREGVIDPARTALAASELIGELTVNLANLKAERSQIAADAPNSPQLPFLDGRIRAFERQVAEERAKITGDAGSLAPKMSDYETLMTEREFAERLLASSTAALSSAQLEARRQRLYIDRVVAPDLADKPTQPNRLRDLLAVFATLMLVYAVGWMVWAGLRENRIHE